MDANLAAGDTAPPPSSWKAEKEEPTGDGADGPVKRWTRVMNSLGFVWITFGETV
ncbi:hypothetical protein HanIR_Chr02g0071991 [Helianthus annuus]|nr:hypothetical protein HanIR_Chr02g0071991 [Helianthus annuus]